MTKLRTTLTFVVAVQVALVLAAAGHLSAGQTNPSSTTTSSALVDFGMHRGG